MFNLFVNVISNYLLFSTLILLIDIFSFPFCYIVVPHRFKKISTQSLLTYSQMSAKLSANVLKTFQYHNVNLSFFIILQYFFIIYYIFSSIQADTAPIFHQHTACRLYGKAFPQLPHIGKPTLCPVPFILGTGHFFTLIL